EARAEYAQDPGGTAIAVVEGAVAEPRLAAYAADLSRIDGVAAVISPAGTFADGRAVAPGDPADARDGLALLTVTTDVAPMSDAGQDQIAALRDVAAPAGAVVSFTGLAAVNADVVDSLLDTLPWVLIVIAGATYVLLFLFTGSLVLPLKAL